MWIYLELRTQRRHQWTVSGWRRVCCHSGPVRQFLWWLGSPVSLHWSRVQRLLTTHRKINKRYLRYLFLSFFLSCMTNVTPFYEGTVQQAAQARLFLVCLYITDQVGGNVRRMFGRISWVTSQSSCPKTLCSGSLDDRKVLKKLAYGGHAWGAFALREHNMTHWVDVCEFHCQSRIYLSIYLK